MPEGFRGEFLTMGRYTNLCTFTCFTVTWKLVNLLTSLPSHVIHAESVNSLKLDVTNFGVIKTLFMIAEQNYTEQGTEVKYWHNLA